jgi:large subunit ribosomal protein L7/L12
MSNVTKEQVIDFLSQMPHEELGALIEELESKWALPKAPVQQKTVHVEEDAGDQLFNVLLVDAGTNKINAIKLVREVKSGFGLKEAKDFVESLPQTLAYEVSIAEALSLEMKFTAIGCKVDKLRVD